MAALKSRWGVQNTAAPTAEKAWHRRQEGGIDAGGETALAVAGLYLPRLATPNARGSGGAQTDWRRNRRGGEATRARVIGAHPYSCHRCPANHRLINPCRRQRAARWATTTQLHSSSGGDSDSDSDRDSRHGSGNGRRSVRRRGGGHRSGTGRGGSSASRGSGGQGDHTGRDSGSVRSATARRRQQRGHRQRQPRRQRGCDAQQPRRKTTPHLAAAVANGRGRTPNWPSVSNAATSSTRYRRIQQQVPTAAAQCGRLSIPTAAACATRSSWCCG